MKAFLRTVLGVTVAASLAAPAARAGVPAAASSACGGAYFMLHTLHVEATATKKTYPRGGTAVLHVTVTRPADREPTGTVPDATPRPASAPAENISVDAAFFAGKSYNFGYDVTNSDGKTTIKIDIPTDAKPGAVNVDFGAHNYINRGGCPDGEEFGYRSYPKMFKIT